MQNILKQFYFFSKFSVVISLFAIIIFISYLFVRAYSRNDIQYNYSEINNQLDSISKLIQKNSSEIDSITTIISESEKKINSLNSVSYINDLDEDKDLFEANS